MVERLAPNPPFLSVLPTQVPSLGTFTIDGRVQRKAGGVPGRKGSPLFVPASDLLQRCGGKRGGGGGAGPRKPGDRIAVHPVSFVDVARHVGKVRQWEARHETKGGGSGEGQYYSCRRRLEYWIGGTVLNHALLVPYIQGYYY